MVQYKNNNESTHVRQIMDENNRENLGSSLSILFFGEYLHNFLTFQFLASTRKLHSKNNGTKKSNFDK